MDYIIHNPDILTEWRMSDTYRLEEEWAEEQYYIQMEYNSRRYKYLKLRNVKTLKVLNTIVRIPKATISIDDDDIPF